jgi:hypothetical protein
MPLQTVSKGGLMVRKLWATVLAVVLCIGLATATAQAVTWRLAAVGPTGASPVRYGGYTYGLVVDAKGDIWANCDDGGTGFPGPQLLHMTPALAVLGQWSMSPAASHLGQMTLTPKGELAMTFPWSWGVGVWTTDAATAKVGYWGGTEQFQYPYYPKGIAVDSAGDFWLSQSSWPSYPASPIIKFPRSGGSSVALGTWATVGGDDAPGKFAAPVALAIDRSANVLYIVDENLYRVAKYSLTTNPPSLMTYIGGINSVPPFNGYRPRSVAVGPGGLVAVTANEAVFVFDKNAKLIAGFVSPKGKPGIGTGFSVAWGPDAAIYVGGLDGPNARIFKFVVATTCSTPGAPKSARVNKSFTVSGTITPSHSVGAKVVTITPQLKVGRKWKSYPGVSAKISASGPVSATYSVSMKLPVVGSWVLRATHSDKTHGAIVSDAKAITITK